MTEETAGRSHTVLPLATSMVAEGLERRVIVRRAVVLGGGGVTGIAWEVGVIQGLREAGIELDPDVVLGTSAGSFVGAALAAGADWETYIESQRDAAPDEVTTVTPPDLYAAWAEAYRSGAGDPVAVGQAFGHIARVRTPQTDAQTRRRAVAHRLLTTDFPVRLRVAVQDAMTGQTVAIGADDGHHLADVVSASGAVPGVSPAVRLGERTFIDGGMVSSANVSLVSGCDEVVVIAPLPNGYGGLPSVPDEVAALPASVRRHLIVPDAQARDAIGPNIYDASRRRACADAGRAQGLAEAPLLLGAWKS